MKLLALNLGSSSLKYKLFGDNEIVLSAGIVDKIGGDAEIRCDDMKKKIDCPDHKEAFHLFVSYLQEKNIIISPEEINVIAHRVVHGGEKYSKTILINDEVLHTIEELFSLSPLHNPVNHKGIVLSQEFFPHARQVAVFDTGFYSTIPEKAYLYALPYQYYEQYSIRRYGFHGISHKYIAKEVLQKVEKRPLKHISCHLGNGSSITAIHNGEAQDTTMGFTPLEGMMMGTRSGSIDPAIVSFLQEKENLSPKEIENILNKKSGILGMSQISNDVRDIYKSSLENNKRALLVLQMISYQISKFIGGFCSALHGLDVITFTAGVGENAFYIRKMALDYLQYLGVCIDDEKNKQNTFEISSPDSLVKVFVIPTNEELQMYREAGELLGGKGRE